MSRQCNAAMHRASCLGGWSQVGGGYDSLSRAILTIYWGQVTVLTVSPEGTREVFPAGVASPSLVSVQHALSLVDVACEDLGAIVGIQCSKARNYPIGLSWRSLFSRRWLCLWVLLQPGCMRQNVLWPRSSALSPLLLPYLHMHRMGVLRRVADRKFQLVNNTFGKWQVWKSQRNRLVWISVVCHTTALDWVPSVTVDRTCSVR